MPRFLFPLMLAATLTLGNGAAFASSCDPSETDVSDTSIMHYRESKCARKVMDQADAAFKEGEQLEKHGEMSRMCSNFNSALLQLDSYRRGDWRDKYSRIAKEVDENFADRLARFEKTICPQKIQLYRHLSGKGDAWAMFRLGTSYAKGIGVRQNDSEALNWLQQAANRDYPEAYMALGIMYSDGMAFAPDYRIAFAWFSKSAALNNAEAQFQLGGLYRKGMGVEKSLNQAVEWYRKAAEQGHEGAKARLKEMYRAKEAKEPLFGY
ncbi:MAG: sel1 repeat family protein [Gammaproteobacteria bacterium]|nr:sel1 repeat family protein [Gammaproteobacteria bacterium]